jgi:hypothetical protein
VAKRIDELEGVTSIEIHIGNSDILANVVYKDGKKLLSLVATIKNLEVVKRIVWSEMVYQSPHKNLEVKLDM